MKKLVKLSVVLVLLFVCTGFLLACTKISDEEKAAVGKYNLTQIIGLVDEDDTEITADSFEKNYIILYKDKSFKLYNLHDGLEYKSKGKWSLNDETLVLKLSGLFAKKEKHSLKEGTITLNSELNGKLVTMVFVKIAA